MANSKIESSIKCSIAHANLTLTRAKKEVEELEQRIASLTAMLDCDHEWEGEETAIGDLLTCSKCGYKIYADELETEEEC